MTQLLTGLPRALDLAQTDLAAIQARLETVHTEAWLPATPDRDRPTPPRQPNADPDFVAGERWDCGLGSHKARVAWERMAGHLDEADALTAAVLELLGGGPHSTPIAHERPLSGVLLASEVERVGRQRARLSKRLHGLRAIHDGLNVPNARWLSDNVMGPRGRPAGTACQHITLALYEVLSVVAIVGNGKKPPICSKCRKIGSIGLRHNGGKCDACAKRDWRAGARERRAKIAASKAS